MTRGFLDLPAPLLDLVDAALGALWLPAALRVALYGALAGGAGLLIYARLSNQPRLRDLGREQLALQREIALHEGEFDELASLVGKLMRVSKDRFAITLLPALAASLPMLFAMPWLSNRFEAQPIAPGTEVCARPSHDGHRLAWSGGRAAWDEQRGCWRLRWPGAGESLQLLDGGREITRLPWPAPARAVYRASAWEYVVANPAGDLPADGPIDALELDVPERELVPFGPRALRGWLAVFFAAALCASLLLKARRNVA